MWAAVVAIAVGSVILVLLAGLTALILLCCVCSAVAESLEPTHDWGIRLETREIHGPESIRLETRWVRNGVPGDWQECATEMREW